MTSYWNMVQRKINYRHLSERIFQDIRFTYPNDEHVCTEQNTNMKVIEICNICGFGSILQFQRGFKKYCYKHQEKFLRIKNVSK